MSGRSLPGPGARRVAGRRVARPRVPTPLAVVRRAAGHRPPAPTIIRITPRSSVTTGLTLVDRPDPGDPANQAPTDGFRPIASLRRRLAALAAAALVIAAAALAAGGTRVVLASFTDVTSAGAAFATGIWSTPTTSYLHNDPTPPTGDTTAQAMLGMDDTAPTAGTLFNYDTDCDNREGRSMNRGSGLVDEAAVCSVATWRSAPLASARALDGTATLLVYARKPVNGGPNPTLVACLRILDPAAGTYTELGSADAAVNTNPSSGGSRAP